HTQYIYIIYMYTKTHKHTQTNNTTKHNKTPQTQHTQHNITHTHKKREAWNSTNTETKLYEASGLQKERVGGKRWSRTRDEDEVFVVNRGTGGEERTMHTDFTCPVGQLVSCRPAEIKCCLCCWCCWCCWYFVLCVVVCCCVFWCCGVVVCCVIVL